MTMRPFKAVIAFDSNLAFETCVRIKQEKKLWTSCKE